MTTVHPPDTLSYSQICYPTPKPFQEEVLPEPEQMDVKILYDLPDIIDVPDELSSDFDPWAHIVLKYQWLNAILIWQVKSP